MMPGSVYQCSDGTGGEGSSGDSGTQPRNPLLCFVCDDYYNEPCLLACYHTFCARCLRGRSVDSKITCPLCGQQTLLKDGSTVPPSDLLMRQLIDLANAENPPCANCDKRDRASMFFCSTCGQALCNHCRENTHRAKMFSTHDIVHMSKCSKEVHRRCAVHGEQYIMFSNSQRNMLCVNCFRDTPAEARLHCVDIDTAYTQCSKKLERSVMSVRDVQNSIREGVMAYRNLLEELQRNTDTEKMTIHSFCQGMQEAINKTQASMVLEVQRQFESKERLFKSHLMNLSTLLPILQMHLLLCQGFASAANKFQFLDLAFPMMDRLASVSHLSQPLRPMQSSQIRTNYRSEFAHSLEPWIGKTVHHQSPAPDTPVPGMYDSQSSGVGSTSQTPTVGTSTPTPLHPAPSRKQHSALKAKALEGEGPFSNHCRSFDTQIKELSVQLTNVRERLCELQRDITLLRRAATPPLAKRHLSIARDCERLDDTLQRYHVELDRLRSVFDTLWQEQLYRIHVEQDIFRSQMNDIVSLRSEVKQLAMVAQQLEPYVKSLSSQNLEDMANLQALIDRITVLQDHYRPDSAQKTPEFRSHESRQMMSPTSDSGVYSKGEGSKAEVPVRESSRPRQTRDQHSAAAATMGSSIIDIYGRTQQGMEGRARGVLSQLIDKVRTKEDRKKSPVQEEVRGPMMRERSKSEGRGKDSLQSERAKIAPPGKGDTYRVSSGNIQQSGAGGSGKVASLYHTISGKVLGSRDSGCTDLSGGPDMGSIPPPPPARRPDDSSQQTGGPSQTEQSAVALSKCLEIREHLENHLKQKLKQRNRMAARVKELAAYQGGVEDESEYQRISDATSSFDGRTGVGAEPGSGSVMIRALVHKPPPSPPHHPVYPHSDTEDSVFYPDTPSSGRRRSSVDLMDRRKTLVVVIGAGKSKSRLMQKQRSWETFPPKKRQDTNSKFCRDPDSFRGGFDLTGLKKADSFEGHEEAVRTLVAAVQETRTLRKPKSPAPSTPTSSSSRQPPE